MQINEQIISNWFGQEVDAGAAAAALEVLDDTLKRRFGVPAYRTPGFTGVNIWKRRYAGDRQPLHPELQHLIRTTTTQGRFETCPVPTKVLMATGELLIPDIYCLDMRWAYAAAAQAITGGKEWQHEERPAGGWGRYTVEVNGEPYPGFVGYTPARYRVRFEAPEGWSHVGILPVRIDGGWHWPLFSGDDQTWADHTELRLAIECGWQVEILERLRCVAEIYDRPLRAWVEALMRMRDDLVGENIGTRLLGFYQTAIHRMILQSIGMLAAGPRTVTRTAESREGLPGHDLAEETYYEDERGQIVYEDYESSGLSQMLHPEIAAAVWAQTRTWLLRKRQVIGDATTDTGALTLLREQIVGFGLDALYLTVDPGWPDDGKIGRWRVKHHVPGPLPSPRNRTELEALGN